MNNRADPERAAIEELVEHYFLGMYEGDVERLRRIFHPQCWVYGERRGETREFPLAGFLEYVETAPVPKAEGEPFDMGIISIDRSGTTAVVKVEDRYQGGHFTDYLTLLKTAEGWRIVNKTFFSED